MLRCAKALAVAAALWLAIATTALPVSAAPGSGLQGVPILAAPDAPVEIPEPVTLILFGTGLAAMAAAATVRRKK